MARQQGWQIVRGRARYWDGDQWVGGEFDPETISPQMLADGARGARPAPPTSAPIPVSSVPHGPTAQPPQTPAAPRASVPSRPVGPPVEAREDDGAEPSQKSSGSGIGRVIALLVGAWILWRIVGPIFADLS